MSGAAAVGGLFLVVYGTIAARAFRRRFLARLAVREAVRRPFETLLVIGGLLLGSAGITAALIAADSMEESAIVNAYRTWGGVDVAVDGGGSVFPAELATRLAADGEVARHVDGVQAGLELVGGLANLDRRQGEAQVRLVGFDPATQEPFGAWRLTDGSTTHGDDLAPGEVLVSEQLAERLAAQTGDRLQYTTQGAPEPLSLTVAGIVRMEGPGAYGLRPSVFAPLGTVWSATGPDVANVVRVSAAGDVLGGLDTAPAAATAVQEALVRAGAPEELTVREVKSAEVDQARENTVWFRAMLVGLTTIVIAAGLALVVNLTMMLAEERRPRLGVLRALGLRRRDLVRFSLFEGALYSLVAAGAGTGVGVFAGRLLARRYAEAFTQFTGGMSDLELQIPIRPTTLGVAFALGALLTLVTVYLAARSTSRMTITAAIRNLPEPSHAARAGRLRTALGGLLVLLGVAGVAFGDPVARTVSGALVIAAVASVTRRRMPVRAHATLTGLALAGWSTTMVVTYIRLEDPNAFFAVFVIAILASVFGLSILAAGNLRSVERAIGLLVSSGRARATLRLPLAELARRPVKTGLSTGAFALVLAMITVLAFFLGTIRPDPGRDIDGYDVLATVTGATGTNLPDDVAAATVRTVRIPTRTYVGPFEAAWMRSTSMLLPLYTLPDDLTDAPPTVLGGRAPDFASDAAVWQTMAAGKDVVVAPFGAGGEEVVLEAPDGPATFVLGGAPRGPFPGVFLPRAAFDRFTAAPLGETILLDLRSDADPVAIARSLEAAGFDGGVDATPTAALLADLDRANRTFFSVVNVLMQMGLLIGILTLGILALRAVIDRRRSVGMLRAIGVRRRQVLSGLLIESGLRATVGVAVGVTTGVMLGIVTVGQSYPDVPVRLDLPTLAGTLALVYAAVLAVTVAPAWRASRLAPAEAVRHFD